MEILTGNELLSGATVYLDRDGNWVEDVQRARLFGKDEAAERDAAIAATKATQRINSLEIEKAEVADGLIVPDRLRERIRAQGPTTPAFDRQHLGEDGHVSIR
jgi:sortase (surface protein transpeptidase)